METKPVYMLIQLIVTIISALVFPVQNPVHGSVESDDQQASDIHCEDLLMGQYLCDQPQIDADTQQAINCNSDTRTTQVPCRPATNISCSGKIHNGTSVGFHKTVPCKWTNGYSFETALLLSIFLGMFGIDRFYLGYPAIGLLKFSTLGFFFFGQLIDVLLIAIQVVTPSDGSDYIIDYYGAGIERISRDNNTYLKPPEYYL